MFHFGQRPKYTSTKAIAFAQRDSVNGFNATRSTPLGKTGSFKIYGGETGGVGNGVYSGMN